MIGTVVLKKQCILHQRHGTVETKGLNISVVRFKGDKLPNLETSYTNGVGKS